MKFLFNLATFLLCVGILGVGVISTVNGIQVGAMADEISEAFGSGPLFPEVPDDNDQTGDNEKPDDNDQTGDIEKPDDNDQAGDNEKPDDNDQTGDNEKPDGNDQTGGNEKPDTEPEKPTLSTNEAKDSFRDLYENHDHDFIDIKKEMITDMISGLLTGSSSSSGSNGDSETPDSGETPEAPEDPDFEENLDTDFSTDFNPDDFEPEDEPENEPEDEDTDINEIITEVMNSYVDNLFTEIEHKKESAVNATEEEKEAIKEEFVQKEADAVAGLVNIANNATEDNTITDDVVKESVDAVLKSDVCMNTVTQAVEKDTGFTEKIQEATEGMSEETKTEIQSKIEISLDDFRGSENYDAAKEQQYHDLANLFGITLGNGSVPNVSNLPNR